jgi:hypothetical protein
MRQVGAEDPDQPGDADGQQDGGQHKRGVGGAQRRVYSHAAMPEALGHAVPGRLKKRRVSAPSPIA